MTCCGYPRATRFCADCGKKIEANPELADLLAYCRQNESRYSKAATSLSRLNARAGRIEWQVGHAEKWKARGDALAAAMDKLAEK